ncbi:MAG: hypothetical protein ACOH5I_24430 [Oligoflexus sp.]
MARRIPLFGRCAALSLEGYRKTRLHWNVRDAAEVYLSIDPGIPQPLSGTVNVQPRQTTSYVLTARSITGEVVSQTVTITVTSRAPEIRSFTADQPRLLPGQTTTLRWVIAYCASAQIVNHEQISVGCTGSWAIAPTQTTNYNLVAMGFNGELSNQIITVTVVEPQPAATVEYFYADPATIDRGQSTTLHWKVRDCSKVMLPMVSPVALPCESAALAQPGATQYYQLTASNMDGLKTTDAAIAVSVRVSPPPVIDAFYAKPASIKWKDKTSLTWKVRNAKRVELIGDVTWPTIPEGSFQLELTKTTSFTLRITGLSDEVVDVPLTVTVAQPTNDDLLAKLLKKMQGG